jgi:essential nuclear protein 1
MKGLPSLIKSKIARHAHELNVNDEDMEDEDVDVDVGVDEDGRVELEVMGDDGSYSMEELDPSEEAIMQAFMRPQEPVRTLGDLIFEKMQQEEMAAGIEDSTAIVKRRMDQKVVGVYERVGEFLTRYRSGKLPKPFKILPYLKNWEELMYITNPDKWTPHATYQATRVFASNLNAHMAQRFYSLVLLPRIQSDLAGNKKLNYHLYASLLKSAFKGGAFYKGIVLPLVGCGCCTLREATIVSSVMKKKSIPVLESAAALLKLAELEYSGACSVFIKTIIEKKYAMPYRVIDGLVDHFCRASEDEREYPVMWQQSLLSFVTMYKEYLLTVQKSRLMQLLRDKPHPLITPEIRRELMHITNQKRPEE